MPYRYLRDPLFVFCLVLYFTNRWVLKRCFSTGFCHSYLNDLICIPFGVPIMLFALRRLGFRTDDAPPKSSEIVIPLIVWSFTFEFVLPRIGLFHEVAFSDHTDIFFYALGAFLASVYWQLLYGQASKNNPPEGGTTIKSRPDGETVESSQVPV